MVGKEHNFYSLDRLNAAIKQLLFCQILNSTLGLQRTHFFLKSLGTSKFKNLFGLASKFPKCLIQRYTEVVERNQLQPASTCQNIKGEYPKMTVK